MTDEFIFAKIIVEWKEQHCRLLKQFLFSLESNDIRYVILKNHEGLPQYNYSKDIDILIAPGKYKQAANLLYKAFRENGVSHYIIHQFERLRCWYGMNPDTHFAIHIDLLEGFLHKGFELLSFDLLYSKASKNLNAIFVLSPVDDNLILLLHSTICYHSIKSQYAKKIAKQYSEAKEEMYLSLKTLLGESASKCMVDLLDAGDYNQIAKLGTFFSHASKKRIFIQRPWFTLYNLCYFLWEKIQRLILCLDKYKIFITVHAPDGTGKTTFIKKVAEELGFFYVCSPEALVNIYHFRPLFLPNLGAVGEKVGIMEQDTNFTIPHRAKSVGTISSFIRMTYYWLDYVIGVPLILRKNAQFEMITIFDRYIYDFLVDPKRTRIALPYWIRKFFSKIVKQPQLVFVLNTDAKTIYQRKQELTEKEINRQLIEYKRLTSLGNHVYLLDASKTPDEIAQEAMKIIINSFTHKIEKK